MEISLLAAHMVGDYIAQTDYMAANKLSSAKVRALHVTCYVLCFLPFLLMWGVALKTMAIFSLLLWLSHFVTDCRRWASGEKWAPKPILVDQAIHLVTLAVLHRYLLS